MTCCLNSRKVDFKQFVEFPTFKVFGIRRWPVNYFKGDGKEIMMVHAPVGTDSIFKGSTRYKIAISGFATSLSACKLYLKDKFNPEMSNMAEVNHTFNGGALRTNLLKILTGVGISPKYKFSDFNFEKLLGLVKKQPLKYPLLMTQALCCIGTAKLSNADEIIRILKNKPPIKFKNTVANSLKAWVRKLVEKKEKDSILCLLGFRKSGKSAIKKLVESVSMGNDGNVRINDYSGRSLFEHLNEIFDSKVFFLLHPAQLSNKSIRDYLKTDEFAKFKAALRTLK